MAPLRFTTLQLAGLMAEIVFSVPPILVRRVRGPLGDYLNRDWTYCQAGSR